MQAVINREECPAVRAGATQFLCMAMAKSEIPSTAELNPGVDCLTMCFLLGNQLLLRRDPASGFLCALRFHLCIRASSNTDASAG